MTDRSDRLFTHYVDRPFDHELRDAALSGQHPLICLVGKERIGKTTAGRRIFDKLSQLGHQALWFCLYDENGLHAIPDLNQLVQKTPVGQRTYIFLDESTTLFTNTSGKNDKERAYLSYLASFLSSPERHHGKVIVVALPHNLPRWHAPESQQLNPKTIIALPYASDDESVVSGFVQRHWPDGAPDCTPAIIRESIDFFGSVSSDCLDVALARIACSTTPEEDWQAAKEEMLAPNFFNASPVSVIAMMMHPYGKDALERPDVFEPDPNYTLRKLAILTAIRDGIYSYSPDDDDALLSMRLYGQIRPVAGTTNVPQFQIGNKVFESYLNSPSGRAEVEQRIHHHQRQLAAG